MYSSTQVDEYRGKNLLASHSSQYFTVAGVMIVFGVPPIALPLVLRLLRVS